jgi:hypothetical protein
MDDDMDLGDALILQGLPRLYLGQRYPSLHARCLSFREPLVFRLPHYRRRTMIL